MSLGISTGHRSSTIFWNRDTGCFEISSLLSNLEHYRWKRWRQDLVFSAAPHSTAFELLTALWWVTHRRRAETVLGRGDSWEDNIKMKLIKHDVSEWEGNLLANSECPWKATGESALNIPAPQRLLFCLFVCLFFRLFVHLLVRSFVGSFVR